MTNLHVLKVYTFISLTNICTFETITTINIFSHHPQNFFISLGNPWVQDVRKTEESLITLKFET